MNIFVTDPDPYLSAKYLDNKRVIKMILESAQLLSTAMHINNLWVEGMYKPTHANHPCTKWAASNWVNYWWLYRHYLALMNIYTERYGRVHKSNELRELLYPPVRLTACMPEPTEFANCCRNESLGIDYRDEPDTFLAYQLYLNDRWDNDKKEPSWDIKI